MDGDAGGGDSGIEDGAVDVVAVHASSAEFREEGGVGVDDAAAETAEGDWAKEFHVSSQDYEVYFILGQGVGDGGVEVFEGLR